MSPRRDRGSASLLVLGIGLAVVLLGAGLAAVGTAILARHRAQAAADLGALAGAPLVLRGAAVACARAAELVAANGAHLTGCRLDGLDLVVTAEARPPGPAGRFGSAVTSARAGPV